MSSTPTPARRALVLGGGGSTGNAWLIGVVAGLADAGLDVTDADLVVGTSAGATAAAQLTGADPADLLAAALAPVPARPAAHPGAAPGPTPGATSGPAPAATAPAPTPGAATPGAATPGADARGATAAVVAHLARQAAVVAAAADPADLRRRIGALALERAAAGDASAPARWRATVASRLPQSGWPDRDVRLTAVDARTGEPVVLDRSSGVDLVDAVAASCSSGPAYPVGDAWYVDGGYRRNENADLAAGCDRVLVLSPFGGRSLTPPAWRMQLAAQVEELRAAGSRVVVVGPQESAAHLFGERAMEAALRPLAARAGAEQGRSLAGGLAALWR